LKKPRDAKSRRKLFILELWDKFDLRDAAAEVPVGVYTTTTRVLFDDDAITDSLVRRTLKDRAGRVGFSKE
jgi:hypothetical protein